MKKKKHPGNDKYRYSIAGKGRYTSEEVKKLLGKPRLNMTLVCRSKRWSVRKCAEKRYRFIQDGEVVAVAGTLRELSGLTYYAENTLWQRLAHPKEEHIRQPYTVEVYWEEV